MDGVQDRLIFYATAKYNEEVGYVLTDNDKCVSTDAETGWNLEMHFYHVSYSNIGHDIMVENNGNQWNITIDGRYGDIGGYDFVQHDLWVMVSYKYAVPEGEVAVEDILEY